MFWVSEEKLEKQSIRFNITEKYEIIKKSVEEESKGCKEHVNVDDQLIQFWVSEKLKKGKCEG